MPFIEGYIKLKEKAESLITSVKKAEILSQEKETPLPYAYPCDNYIDTILSNTLVRKSLHQFSDKYCKEQIHNIKATSQLITPSSHPGLCDVLHSCSTSLNVQECPQTYITGSLQGINALSIGTDTEPIILVSRKAAISLPEEELKFIIGHELGHILQKNLMCHTAKGLLDNFNNKNEALGAIVAGIIDIPLNKWYRCSEFTADRAGLICCGNIETIKKLFNKIFERKSRTGFHQFTEIYKNHPHIESRLANICEFAQSHIYKKIISEKQNTI